MIKSPLRFHFCSPVIQKLSSEVDEQRLEVEKALKALEGLAKHKKILSPAPIEGYRNKLKRRWETVCQQVCTMLPVQFVCVYTLLSSPSFVCRLRAEENFVLVATTT